MEKDDILRFIINNDEMEIVKARINRFNPLKVLRMEDHEVRHSNILAWMLDPNENHNFDDKFLKRFLLQAILNPSNGNVKTKVDNIYELQNMNFYDCKVYREQNNIDILVVSEMNKIIILIENKVYSGEHSNQLNRYLNIVNDIYEGYVIIPIFLTLEGLEASNDKYFSLSYENVLEVIEFIIKNYEERTSSQVLEFLKYYITIIKEKYYMDNELKILCKDIYFKNKDVIDLIHSIGNEIDIENSIDAFNKKFPYIEKVSSRNKVYWFMHVDFKLSKKMDENWGDGYPICYWFSEYAGKLKITLEIGPFDIPQKRIQFLEALENNSIKIQTRAKELGRKYTRIYTKTMNIKDWTDSEEIADAMITLFDKADLRDVENKVIKTIKQFNW